MVFDFKFKGSCEVFGKGGLILVGVVIGWVLVIFGIGGGLLIVFFFSWCSVLM